RNTPSARGPPAASPCSQCWTMAVLPCPPGPTIATTLGPSPSRARSSRASSPARPKKRYGSEVQWGRCEVRVSGVMSRSAVPRWPGPRRREASAVIPRADCLDKALRPPAVLLPRQGFHSELGMTAAERLPALQPFVARQVDHAAVLDALKGHDFPPETQIIRVQCCRRQPVVEVEDPQFFHEAADRNPAAVG